MFYAIGAFIYVFVRCIVFGFYTVNQNERGVKTRFGRADRLGSRTAETPLAETLTDEEKQRYNFPIVRVIGPGLHFKMPWEKIYKVSVATETANMAVDLELRSANQNGTMLEAVTRDQLNIGLNGQIRFRVSEQNLYAYFFGIKRPLVHVMGYFVSILREKIANYESSARPTELQNATDTHISDSISINDLRKNLREINDNMLAECQSSEARYGLKLEASLITSIEPPTDVESALAAINTAFNNVSSEISLAKASADQTIVLSRRAVEIETLKVQAEVEPLMALARQLKSIKASGPDVLTNFVRNVRLNTFQKAKRFFCKVQDSDMEITLVIGFASAVIFEALLLPILRLFLVYTTITEGTCKVYVLFGNVFLVLTEPGLHFLWPKLSWRALILSFMGQVHTLDLRMDQVYLRSQPVNSEEGAPMGVGVWYETFIQEPVAYLFRNSDPWGSLAANVSNATVRCLSNLPLAELLEDRHTLSQMVRTEVSQKSLEWGYNLGSVYIRKVHFRDNNMISEIEGKVVNRLRQVTASIKQDGENQVHVITNTAQRTASIEFGKAGAIRPQLVGAALAEIAEDKEVATALFDVLEVQKILENPGELVIVPAGHPLLSDLVASASPTPRVGVH